MNSSYLVEQTVISIKLGAKKNDVELMDATSGVDQDDLSALLDYAARVELLNGRFDSKNLFSFMLPSKSGVIGRLTPILNPKSGSSDELYFQCLVVTPETFYHAGANPATIIHLALNTMHFALYSPGVKLYPFVLAEGVASVKSGDLRHALRRVGARSIAVLIQSILENRQTFFVSSYNAYLLVGCLFNLLPIHARRALSFAVGVRFRDEPNMKLIGASIPQRMESSCTYSVEADSFIDVRDTTAREKLYRVDNYWSVYVERVLISGEIDSFSLRLAEEFVAYAQARSDELYPIMSSEDVSDLGRRWLNDYENLIDPRDAEAFNRDPWQEDWDAGLDEGIEELDNEFALGTPWDDVERTKDGEEWKDGDSEVPREYSEEPGSGRSGANAAQQTDANDIKVIVVYPSTSDNPNIPEELRSSQDRLAETESKPTPKSETSSRVAESDFDSSDPNSSSKDNGAEIAKDMARFSSVFTPRRPTIADEQGGDFEEPTLHISGISLSPFALLTAEFPEKDVVLRKLDALVSKTIERDEGARDELMEFWNDFDSNSDDDFVLRVREIYLSFFKRKTLSVPDEETRDHTTRLLGILDVMAIMI